MAAIVLNFPEQTSEMRFYHFNNTEVLADKDNTIQEMWETITKLETEFFSPDGTHKSDLSTFIAHDISKIMLHLHNNEFIRKMIEKEED